MKQVNIQTKEITKTNSVTSIEIEEATLELDRSARFPVRLLDENNNLVDIEIITIEGAEYDNWGADDSYIIDIILGKLNMTKI